MIANLIEYLDGQEPGRLETTADLEERLVACWGEFEGSDAEGMAPEKLVGRMEAVEWTPPLLTFVVERHGRTCLGSTRADLHRWTVNVAQKTATCEKAGERQVRPMAPRLSVQPLVEEIGTKIVEGVGDERLVWQDKGMVRVALSTIFPADSGFKRTIEGRRKRFIQGLIPLLEEHGWRYEGRCMFIKCRHSEGQAMAG